jgi:hypothetical protein
MDTSTVTTVKQGNTCSISVNNIDDTSCIYYIRAHEAQGQFYILIGDIRIAEGFHGTTITVALKAGDSFKIVSDEERSYLIIQYKL